MVKIREIDQQFIKKLQSFIDQEKTEGHDDKPDWKAGQFHINHLFRGRLWSL